MQGATVAWVALGVTLGCGSGRSVQSPIVGRAPRTARVAAAPSKLEPLALPPPIELPHEVACTLTAARWPVEAREDSREGDSFLRFGVGGPAFAKLYAGSEVRLALPVALASAGGTLTVDAHGIVLQGHLEAAEMPLYPASAFVMSDVFVPNQQLRLLWRSAKPGRITVATQPLHRVGPWGRTFSAERDCGDISIGAVIIDDTAIDAAMGVAVAPAEAPGPWPWLRPGDVALSAVPAGGELASVEVFEPRDDTLLIHPPLVLSVQKGFTRIALHTFGGVLFGWVPSAQLTTSTAIYLDLSHDAFAYVGPPPPRGGSFVTCDHDVPLVAEAFGERRLVGAIRPGTRFERQSVASGWRQIGFRDAGFATVEGASFWARESDLAGCVFAGTMRDVEL